MIKPIAVVAEDQLTQAVLHKCISEVLPAYRVARTEVKRGRGNVQRELGAYAALAEVMPVLIGVDLDGDDCAPTLLGAWGRLPPQAGLLLRVAVREIESWVLADQRRVASFIGAAPNEVPRRPDELVDPKRSLLELAREHAGPELKADLVPRNYNASYPRIGPAYNLRLGAFVAKNWRPHVARKKSPSLERAMVALERLN
jgi:hypothetical protein